MKSFDTDIKKYAQKTRLKAAERRELRERVLAYMEYHPLPKHSVRKVVEQIESQQLVKSHFNTLYTRIAYGVFATLLLIAVPIVAERSVPGDVLYSFKTNINEGVRMTLANSPYEKVVLETSLMERRIAEARLLESEGKLTAEIEVAISETVKEHADAVKQNIEELRIDNEEEAAIAEITFSSALDVQSAVLDTSDESGTSSAIAVIAGVVKDAKMDVIANNDSTTPSFSSIMASVELETTRAYELFESIDDVVINDNKSDIERRLEDIDRKIISAQISEEGNSEDVIADLIDALTLTQKLIAFMTDIDVSTNVALETLVPIELTNEERETSVENIIKNVAELLNEIKVRFDYIENEDLLEKVQIGITKVETLIGTTTSYIDGGNIDSAEESIEEAHAYVTDLDKITSDVVVDNEDIDVTEEDPIIEAVDDISDVQKDISPEESPEELSDEAGIIEIEPTDVPPEAP